MLSVLHCQHVTKSDQTTNKIYDTYKKMCSACDAEVKSLRSFQIYLSELTNLGLLITEKTSDGRKKGVKNIITSDLEAINAINILLYDYNVGDLETMFQNYVAHGSE